MRSKWVYLFCLSALVGALLVQASFLNAQQKETKPGIAAVVNGKTITTREVDMGAELMARQFTDKGQAPDPNQMAMIKKNVLEELIGIELLTQEVKKKKIKVEPSAVATRFEALKKSFPDEKAYNDALAKDQMKESELKKRVEEGLLMQELVSKEVVQKVSLTAEESKAFYDGNPNAFKQPEQVHASHILISVDPKAGDAEKKKARKEIEDILKKVKKGEDFAALAKQYSKCPSSSQGGDLGLLRRGQTVKPFEDAAFSMKPGQTSGIVETEFGFHIIKVTEKKEERMVPYEEAKEGLEKHLKETKVKEGFTKYMDGLKANAKIDRVMNK